MGTKTMLDLQTAGKVATTLAATDLLLAMLDPAGTPDNQVITIANAAQTLLDSISTTQGVILYNNGTDWVALGTGTSGYYLKTQGAGANPAWAALPTASDTVSGIVELATDAETITGTDTARAITPANLQAMTASDSRDGIVELATVAEVTTGTDTGRAVTPASLKGIVQRVRGTVANPNGYYTAVRPQIPIFRADAAVTITRIHIHGADLTPTAEMALDLKFADDLNTGGFANATVIDVCDTTNGVFTATGSFDDATVPSGKYVYWLLDAAPHADWKDFFFEIYYTYD